ncbi:putative ribonuclease H-like domain-containing protein [Tanacetum coccineum]
MSLIVSNSYNAHQAKYVNCNLNLETRMCIIAHKLAVKKLESQLRASHKQQSSLTEKLNFQANQIFEKDEKLKKYRRIGMKAVKDKDALQKIVDSWFASSKNLWKLIDCGMSSTVKIGLGYGIQSNAEVLGYEEEISRGIFAFRETDAGNYDIPLYSRFKQVEYKGVPHPLSGDYTPREQEDIDDSLYEYGKYGPQPQSPSPTESDASSTVYSTCQSNDSDGELGAPRWDIRPGNISSGIFLSLILSCVFYPFVEFDLLPWSRAFGQDLRLGHLNFKNLNKLVKDNLVRGLPSKSFKNDHTCVACQKGKQHKASCKAKIDRYVTHPLHTLHMDLFGPTSVRSINHASYCLVITDDYSRFCWVFFLAKKDETSDILKTFIRQIENQLNQKVKIIRSDNGTEFKNRVMLEFCGEKGIKQEFSNARTPQQNGVAERMNRTLIEAARTMLADSHLPTTFWAEAVNTACYTFNRVRVTKPQNKTPYELLFGHKPILSYIRPFGCHVTILNTLSPLGKFDGKSDEGFLVGYSVNSKAFRVYNLVTKRVEVNLHVNFLEEKPNVQGIGHRWMFDLDYLTDSMNYIPVSLQNQANPAGSKEVIDIDVQTEEDADLMVVSSTSLTGATRKAAVSEKIATKKPSSTPISKSKSADDIMFLGEERDALL